jgi:hypothetical protein
MAVTQVLHASSTTWSGNSSGQCKGAGVHGLQSTRYAVSAAAVTSRCLTSRLEHFTSSYQYVGRHRDPGFERKSRFRPRLCQVVRKRCRHPGLSRSFNLNSVQISPRRIKQNSPRPLCVLQTSQSILESRTRFTSLYP